jgi:hypothetical protein
MTILKDTPVIRETAALYKGRPLIVELHAGYMVIRPKGKQLERYILDYGAAFETAAKIESRRLIAEQQGGAGRAKSKRSRRN